MFLGDDDVVSEQIPPPAASASLRKIAVECTERSSDERIDPKGEIPEGYCLNSVDSLKEFARTIHSNLPCASGEIIILLNHFTQYALVLRASFNAILVFIVTYFSISLFFVVVDHLELHEKSEERFSLSSSM